MSKLAAEQESQASDPLPTLRQTLQRLRYLYRFVRPHWKLFAVAVATSMAAVFSSLAVPLAFKYAIDEGVVSKDSAAVGTFVALALVASVVTLALSAINLASAIFTVRVLNDLRVALFAHIQRQGLDFFHTMRTGTVISRLTNDVDAVESVVSDGVFMVFSNIVLLFGIQAILFTMDWRLALATNVIFPIMVGATIAFRYYSTRAYRLTRERMASVTAYLAENLNGIRIVQAFAAEERAAAAFDDTNERYRRANMATIWQNSTYFPGVELLATIGTAIVLWYGGYLQERDLVTFGVLFAFIALLNDFFDPIQQLSQFYSSFLSAMAALDKIMGVMEIEPTIADDPNALVPSEGLRGKLELRNVSFSYGAGAPEVLHNINLSVAAGETLAIVGQTGAGKSTLVRLLTRFWDPDQGQVLIDGVDAREYRITWLRRQMGIVPQEGFLFAGTIADNIRYGRPDASDAEVREAAEAVGAHRFIEAMDGGYDADVGERGGRLSTGQRQLIAFARAMLADPAMLILDEATSSVDVETELQLADAMRELIAGRTAIVVAHRLSTIRGADRIIVVADGTIVQEGQHDELVAMDGHYAELYGSWTAPETTLDERLSAT